MRIILEKLNELKIDLILLEIDKPGHYVAEARTIFVSNQLDEGSLKEVILHELKHVMDHSDYIDLYNKSFVYRSKMEYEADLFMIDEVIEENEGNFNFSAFIENYKIGIGYDSIVATKAK